MIIAQISDTHIVPKGQAWKSLPETSVAERLKSVVDALNNLSPKPDLVLLTGDAIDNGGKEGYEHLKEILEGFSVPFYIIPGNHDDRELMRAAFQEEEYMPSHGYIQYVLDNYDVRLIALDTVIPHKDRGMLCDERVDWLNQALQQDREKPTLIFMHHPLIKSGYALLDDVRCSFPDSFEDMLASFSNIIGIVSGHYHTSYTTTFGKTVCFVAPSVAPVHFLQKADDDHVKGILLANPSFVLHKWVKGVPLLSEVVQTVEPTARLALCGGPLNEMDR